MISVIIPVCNVEEYLDDCLTSILAQTYSNLEILLVNDGSTDNSGILCDKYAQKDSRVKVFHKENGGVSSARNLGIEKSVGKYITFVDPDDWVELNMYETIIKQFQRADVDAVFCGYWENYSNNQDDVIHAPEKQGIVNGRDALYQCFIEMSRGYFTSVWNKVFKAEFVKKSGVRFESFLIGEDEVWLAQILPAAQRVFLINTPLYHWRKRENSVLYKKDGYAKWYSALESKTKVISAVEFDTELLALSKAKAYIDEFDKVWKAYVDGELSVSKDFMQKLKPYESIFYKCNNYSKKRRTELFMVKMLVILKFPRSGIKMLYKIKKYVTNQEFRLKDL